MESGGDAVAQDRSHATARAGAPPTMTAASGDGAPPAWLYGVAVFAGAWLVFWVQPLAVRGVLPVLGGSPAVWNTAMVFFQGALLGGYALAHGLARHATPAGQLVVLGALWAGIAVTAPIGGVRLLGETPPAGLAPALWLLGTLAGALGVAFVAVASLAPLVQSWLARAGAGQASADPYFLYAASNVGSAGALLAFPFLLEPYLGLDRQAWLWSAAALALAPFLAILWRAAARGQARSHGTGETDAAPVLRGEATAGGRITGQEARKLDITATESGAAALPVARILALTALPSALLLAVTQFLTTDVAAVPLLWIVPLALYLATFVHAFARRTLIPQWLLARALAPALIILAIPYPLSPAPLAFGLFHLAVFVLAALYCHGALVRLRPPAADLTRFYLLVSTGGLIGGLLVALVAPLVFNDVHEYPIALVMTAALLPAAAGVLRRGQWITVAVALGIVACGLAILYGYYTRLPGAVSIAIVVVVAFAAPLLLILRSRPACLAGALLLVFLVPSLVARDRDGAVVARERTFFGVYRIVDSDGLRSFYHGTTLHGAERRLPDGTINSLTTYYGPGTPYAEVMTSLARRPAPLVLGIAGLGTGSLACFARPGDEVRIYEIDPAVVRLARTHFAALRNCAPDALIATGDARLLLAREEAAFHFLALDAFTSDAIPVHLLTLEAFQSYRRILAPDGILVVHISNRHLHLEPVVAAIARHTGMAARVKRYAASEEQRKSRASTSSHLVVLARQDETLRALDLDASWVPLEPAGDGRLWTDDYTSIVPLLRWW